MPLDNDYGALALNPVGSYLGGVQLKLTPEDITVYDNAGREIGAWPYNCIRQFREEKDVFAFTSGRRGPYGVNEYLFQMSPRSLPKLKQTISDYTGENSNVLMRHLCLVMRPRPTYMATAPLTLLALLDKPAQEDQKEVPTSQSLDRTVHPGRKWIPLSHSHCLPCWQIALRFPSQGQAQSKWRAAPGRYSHRPGSTPSLLSWQHLSEVSTFTMS